MEWQAMASNANRHNLKMIPVDNPMPLVVVVVSNRPSLQPRQQAAAEVAAEDSSRSKERVFK